jgi:hypothetical protein
MHHYARLIAVAIATVSFSTPIYAQQEPTSPTTLEALVETLGGRLRPNEQGEVVEVNLIGSEVTDAGLAHLAGLTALEALDLDYTQVTDAGLAHLTGLTALEILFLDNTQVTDVGVAELQQALPNCRILPLDLSLLLRRLNEGTPRTRVNRNSLH